MCVCARVRLCFWLAPHLNAELLEGQEAGLLEIHWACKLAANAISVSILVRCNWFIIDKVLPILHGVPSLCWRQACIVYGSWALEIEWLDLFATNKKPRRLSLPQGD